MVTTMQTLVLELPEKMYAYLREIAEERNRSVEVVAFEQLAVSLLELPSADFDAVIDTMDVYSDEALWEVIYQRLTKSERQRYDTLVALGRQTTLSSAQQAELEALIDKINRQMLFRSKAVALLVERGYDVQSRFQDGEWKRV